MLSKTNLLVGLVLLMCAGCEHEGRGFSLPPGSADSGKVTFLELGCNVCHSIRGENLEGDARELLVLLGGPTTRIKTYGDLVTSVINPSHKIARAVIGEPTATDGTSKMINFNEIMTVQQLVDLVTYLQTTYKVIAPEPYYPFAAT